ncbi:hypothetical protein QTG54_011618 [Skeletonema marinoi]|uniref:Uncharacterized protein n=1 Tax=Skeletonema marinoi TaxID=267567 RepID=A0AAD9D865_9STRA|nr:hypothetical protein QTG54_011618 [Skeletonema marinoi]
MTEELKKNNNEQHRDATTRIRMNSANFHRSHSTPPNQTTPINPQNNDENNAIRNNNNETASAVILLGISTGAARLSAYNRSTSDSRDGLREGLQISSTFNNLDDAPVSLLYDDCYDDYYDDSDKENIDPLQTKVIKARCPARPMCTFHESDDDDEEDGFVQVLMPLGQKKKKVQLNNKSGGVSNHASITVNNGQDDVLVEKKCNRLDNVKRRGDPRHGTINSKKKNHSMIKSTKKNDDLMSKTSATSSNVSRTKKMSASHNKKMTSNDLQQEVDKALQPLMNSLSLRERRFNH